MKTIFGTMVGAVAITALAACHHDDQAPPRTATGAQTTTTTSYQPSLSFTPGPSTVQQAPQESASSTYPQEPALTQEPMLKPSAANPAPLDPSLTTNEPGASAKPVTGTGPTEPGPVNAKQPDNKSKTAAAVTDQGNSNKEVQATARIRKAVMASNTLGVGAKNVKIITQGSKVTLRGNVKTPAEKNEIAGIARNTDGITEVDDQLVVKP